MNSVAVNGLKEEILLKMLMPYPEHFIKSNHNEVQALKSQPIMRWNATVTNLPYVVFVTSFPDKLSDMGSAVQHQLNYSVLGKFVP